MKESTENSLYNFKKKKNRTYKTLFLKGLSHLYTKGQINYYMNFDEIESMVVEKKWVVHNTPPTIDTSILENYLARYINRVAISYSTKRHDVRQSDTSVIVFRPRLLCECIIF